jgi:hypothetical protein
MTTKLPNTEQLQHLLTDLREKPQTPAVERASEQIEQELEELPPS